MKYNYFFNEAVNSKKLIFMPFVDTTSHLTTKPYNFDIKCHSNSESYDLHGFFGTRFRGGQNFLLTVGIFYNKREYSGADWLVPLISLEPGLELVMKEEENKKTK